MSISILYSEYQCALLSIARAVMESHSGPAYILHRSMFGIVKPQQFGTSASASIGDHDRAESTE